MLDRAFDAAQAIVVLLTPDDIAYLRTEYASDDDPELDPAAQARPNVLFEAGMAFGRNPERTVIVELGRLRPFSDIGGRHTVRMNNSPEKRLDLAERLRTAGCNVEITGRDWMKAGDLTPPPPPGNGLPLGHRLPNPGRTTVGLDATFSNKGRGKGDLHITNHGSVDIYDMSFKLPDEIKGSLVVHADLPLPKLPAGKSATFPAMRVSGHGRNTDHFELTIRGRTDDGEEVSVQSFVNLAE